MSEKKTFAERRDEAALELNNSIFRLELWMEPPDFDKCFIQGADFGYRAALEDVGAVVDAIKWYAAETEDSNRGMWDYRGVSKAREALDLFAKLKSEAENG